jgi:hypothetical protein
MIMRAALCCPHFFAQKVLTNEAEYSKIQTLQSSAVGSKNQVLMLEYSLV